METFSVKDNFPQEGKIDATKNSQFVQIKGGEGPKKSVTGSKRMFFWPKLDTQLENKEIRIN